MIAIDILERLCTHLVLKFITLDGICTLSRLVTNLKREILQPQAWEFGGRGAGKGDYCWGARMQE